MRLKGSSQPTRRWFGRLDHHWRPSLSQSIPRSPTEQQFIHHRTSVSLNFNMYKMRIISETKALPKKRRQTFYGGIDEVNQHDFFHDFKNGTPPPYYVVKHQHALPPSQGSLQPLVFNHDFHARFTSLNAHFSVSMTEHYGQIRQHSCSR